MTIQSTRRYAADHAGGSSLMTTLTCLTLGASYLTGTMAGRDMPGRHPRSGLKIRFQGTDAVSTALDTPRGQAGQCVRDGAQNKTAYQQTLIDETKAFRGTKFGIFPNKEFTGPWTEERFFNHWQATQPHVERVFIPIGWTGTEAINNGDWKRLSNWAMTHYLDSLDKSLKYFTVVQIAKGFENDAQVHVDIPGDLDLTVFGTGPTTATRIVPLPLLKREMTPQGLPKDITVSFTGTFQMHPAREALREQYGDYPGWVFEEPNDDWAKTLERSRFVLCPRGWGVTSFRLYEALQLGAGVIYVTDDAGAWLPYPELINWTDIAVVIHQRDLPKLGDIITHLEETNQTDRMLEKVSQVRHMFTYDFMNEYILSRLQQPDPPIAQTPAGNDTVNR